MESFLGLPIKSTTGELVGIMGAANRPGGYDDELVSFLDPFLSTYGVLIEKKRAEEHRKVMEDNLMVAKEAAQAAADVNFSAFLSKPVTSSTLLDAVMRAMGHTVVRESRDFSRHESVAVDIDKLRGARLLLVEDNEINQELAMELLTSNDIFVEVAGDRQKVLDAGMNDHIAKPINVDEMFQLMARWITPAKPIVFAGKSDKEQVIIPELDGINTTNGLARTQGNSSLYLKLLLKTAESQADFVREYEGAVENNDWERATRLAHTLKGVAGNIGAEALQNGCAALEKQAGKQQEGAVELNAVDVELQRVLKSVDSLAPLTADKKPFLIPVPGLSFVLDDGIAIVLLYFFKKAHYAPR